MKANKGFKTAKKTHLFATRGFLTFLVKKRIVYLVYEDDLAGREDSPGQAEQLLLPGREGPALLPDGPVESPDPGHQPLQPAPLDDVLEPPGAVEPDRVQVLLHRPTVTMNVNIK